MTEARDGSELAAALGAAEPPAGAGVVAAHVVTLAAALCESLARTAIETWPDARGLVVQAIHLRMRAAEARAANGRAYATARERLRPATPPATGGDAMLRAALLEAADALLRIGALAADCAALAAAIAPAVVPDLRPDAVGAAEMAAGAAATIRLLIDVNLALTAEDPARAQAAAQLAAARESAAEARRVLPA